MTTYYEIKQDGSIGDSTEDKDFADELGFTGVTEEKIIQFNDINYFENDLAQNTNYQVHLVTQQKFNANRFLLMQIADVEQSQLRSMREMMISPNDIAKQKLQDIDTQITTLRGQLL